MSNSPLLASGSYDLTAKIWDIRTCKNILNVPHPESQINTMAFVPNALQLAIGTWQKMKIFDIAGSQPVVCPSYEGAGKNITVIGFELPHGHWIYCGGDDGHCRIFDTNSRQAALTPQRAYEVKAGITSVVLHANGVELFIADQSGQINLWDLSKPDAHEQIVAPRLAAFEFVVKLAVHPNGQILTGITNRANLVTWELIPAEIDSSQPSMQATTCARLIGITSVRKGARGLSLRYTPDGRLLIVTFTDKLIIFLRADEFPEYQTSIPMQVDCDWNWDTLVTSDTKYLFTGGSDGKIKLWEIERKQLVTKLEGHQKGISALALSVT